MSIERKEPGEKELTMEERHKEIMARSRSLEEAVSAIKNHPEMIQDPQMIEALSHIPQNGNDAYTLYHGREWKGVLAELNSQYGGRILGWIVPKNPDEDWGFHGYKEVKKKKGEGKKIKTIGGEDVTEKIEKFRGLTVGYDDGIRWDEEKKMYYAPADSD